MKQRTGFVSNSSSSSFILEFTSPASSEEDIIKLLGAKPGDTLKLEDIYYLSSGSSDSATVDAVAEYLFRELNGPLSKSQLKTVLNNEFSEELIFSNKDKKLYNAIIDYGWEGFQHTIESTYKKYKIKNYTDSLSLPENKLKMFILEFSEAQMEYYGTKDEYTTKIRELKTKYIPEVLNSFYKSDRYYYTAEFSDSDGSIACWAENSGLKEFKIRGFNHH